MAVTVAGNRGVFRINKIDGIAGMFPGIYDAFARIDAADVFAAPKGHAGVVGHDVAGGRESHADDEMTIVRAVVPVAGQI